MKINTINVIPPNIPTSRHDNQSFGMDNEKELYIQKQELANLSKDKSNPFASIVNFLAITTGVLLTFAAMKVTLNKSLSLIGEGLQNKYVQKISSIIGKTLKNSAQTIMSGCVSAKNKIVTSKAVQRFNETNIGVWINPKLVKLKKETNTLISEIKQVSSEKAPKKEVIKNYFVNSVAALTGVGMLLKELGITEVNVKKIEEEVS